MAYDNEELMQAYPEQIIGLDRQRALAAAMLKQGMTAPQGDMVGNRFVAPSGYQYLGNLAQALVGNKMATEADTQQAELGRALRKQESDVIAQGMDLYKTDPSKAAALLLGQGGKNATALGQKLLEKQFKDAKWEPSTRIVNGNKETGWVNVNSDNPETTFRLGSRSPDLETLRAVDEGLLPGGGMPNFGAPTGGQPRAIGGFDNSINNLWPREGGFTPRDGSSGAPANYGINQKFHPDIDVSKLTQDQAKQIYKRDYWDAIGADKLSPAAQEVAFDAAVNQGPEFAKQLVAATGGDPQKMLQMRAERYAQTAQRSPEDAAAYKGWMNRLNGIQQNISQQQSQQYGNYQYNPNLSPKENRQEAGKFYSDNREKSQEKIRAAVDSVDIIKEVAQLLPKATGSGVGADIKDIKAYWGMPTKQSPQDAQLKVLGAKLVANVPRFKGADSDKDVAQYMAAAGDVANERKPWGDRMAALKTIYDLNKKYAPEAYAGMSEDMFSAQPVERPKLSDTGKVLKDTFTTSAGFKRIQ